ncbi:MAG: hypothetical protein AB7V27_18080 [Candidatus Binatia bacterium]
MSWHPVDRMRRGAPAASSRRPKGGVRTHERAGRKRRTRAALIAAAAAVLASGTEQPAALSDLARDPAGLPALFRRLASPPSVLAQGAPDEGAVSSAREDALESQRSARPRQPRGRPVTVEPPQLLTPQQASRTLPARITRMRTRFEDWSAGTPDAERPRSFEIPDPPEDVDAPPAPDAPDGEIAIERLREEVQ